MKFSTLPDNVKHVVKCYENSYTVEIHNGIKWYSNAYDIALSLSNKYRVDINQVVGVMAALSPNNEWNRNCIDAENLLKIWSTFRDLDLNKLDKFDQIMIRQCLRLVKVCTFNANRNKAIKILMIKGKNKSIKKVQKILFGKAGYKVVEFMDSILGRDNCCIDGHAFSIWAGVRIPTTKTPPIGKKLRESIKADYKLATQFINYDLGTKFKTSEIQAITWTTHKRIYS